MNQIQKNANDIKNHEARLKALEDNNNKIQNHPLRNIAYKNTKGIIFVCINYNENIQEANEI